MKRKKLIIVIILVIIIVILFIFMRKSNIFNFQEDFIFFKIFNNSKQNNTNINSDIEHTENKNYIFNVKYDNLELKNINLGETINPKTLIKEKIAPGTEGNFNIILKSNEILNYQIKFVSKNTKPKNLKFYKENDKKSYNSLEELENELVGSLEPYKDKIIKINWKWEYSMNNIKDLEDTKDGQFIRKYNFNIYVIGKE